MMAEPGAGLFADSHWLATTHQFGECPDKRVNSVRRWPALCGIPAAHLIFQFRVVPNVRHPALLIKRRYRLCPELLAARSDNHFDRNSAIDGPDSRLNHRTTIILFGNDAVSP